MGPFHESMRVLTRGQDFHKNIQYNTKECLIFLPPARQKERTTLNHTFHRNSYYSSRL